VFDSGSAVSLNSCTQFINIRFLLPQESTSNMFFSISTSITKFVFLHFEKCIVSMKTEVIYIKIPLIHILPGGGNRSVSCDGLLVDGVMFDNTLMVNINKSNATVSFSRLLLKNVERAENVFCFVSFYFMD
jgi:hypothetical protein